MCFLYHFISFFFLLCYVFHETYLIFSIFLIFAFFLIPSSSATHRNAALEQLDSQCCVSLIPKKYKIQNTRRRTSKMQKKGNGIRGNLCIGRFRYHVNVSCVQFNISPTKHLPLPVYCGLKLCSVISREFEGVEERRWKMEVSTRNIWTHLFPFKIDLIPNNFIFMNITWSSSLVTRGVGVWIVGEHSTSIRYLAHSYSFLVVVKSDRTRAKIFSLEFTATWVLLEINEMRMKILVLHNFFFHFIFSKKS